MAGTITVSTISDGTNSTSSTNCIQGSAKAWVSFTGVSTINASYNVSSITNNATGDYTINFTNAFSDNKYCATLSSDRNLRQQGTPATTSFECINAANYGAAQTNVLYGYAAFFR